MPVRGRRVLTVVAGCAMALVTACGVQSGTAGAAGSPLRPSDTVVVTAAAGTRAAAAPVPWTGRAAPAYRAPDSAALPPPPGDQFAPCAAAQLAGSPGKPVITAGQFTWYLVLTNTGTTPCTLDGGPHGVVGVRANGSQRTLAAGMTTTGTGWFGDLVGPPANVAPGQSAQFGVWTPTGCPAGQVDKYTALVIGIGDTGHVRIRLLDGLPLVVCQWLGVSGFGVPQPAEAPSASPLDVLTVRPAMPAAAAPGTTVDYTVTLANPAGRAVALRPCPSFEEFIAPPGAKAQAAYYYLNCQAAPAIPARGSVTFAMRIRVPEGAGLAKFGWELQGTTVSAGGVVRLTAAAR